MRKFLLIGLTACTFTPAGTNGGGPLVSDAAASIDARLPDAALPDARPPDKPDAAGQMGGDGYTHLVTSGLRFPTTTFDAAALSFDIDGDGDLENKLGYLLVQLKGAGLDVNPVIDTALRSGLFVVLHALRSNGQPSDANAAWAMYPGAPRSSPDLTSGHGMFTLAESATPENVLDGAVVDGRFASEPGTLLLSLVLSIGSPAVTLRLIEARVEAVPVWGCAGGRIGGAITRHDIDETVLPAVAVLLDNVIGSDGNCRHDEDACGAQSRSILQIFDKNGDRVITAAEVRENVIVQAFFSPDLDLLGADGQAGPDGAPESLSVGLGFSCAGAIFSVPWE